MTTGSPGNKTPLIEARGLHTFYGDSHILHGIDITIHKSETVSLIGRNGMGKTTLLRTLIGFTPPRKGTIKVHGRDIKKTKVHKIVLQGIAYVPDDRGIFPNLSVHENLIMAARSGPNGRDDWPLSRVLELFPRLKERLGHMGNQLSGGEQQMLTIGRALMTNPDLILLDEATEGLAPKLRKIIWTVIRQIKKAGIATIIVDKDIKTLLDISDRNIIIEKGKIIYEGGSDRLIKEPEILKKYVGV
jgi:branched-chain amino acid transport system ATP-binding protein